MRVICAPDSFKESISAAEAADAMARGAQAAGAATDRCPVADGGEGTVDAIVAATGGRIETAAVTGPVGEPVTARWGRFDRDGEPAAVIEMAEASGLALVPTDRRNPERTTTAGTGELIARALDTGVGEIIVGVGGSATTDGGAGMAGALGVRFLDSGGGPIAGPLTGKDLARIDSIDARGLDPRIGQVRITVACDVTNPLTGENGAAAVYGPQKGASPAQVKRLEAGLENLARLWARDLGRDVAGAPGAGAAGGLGGGLMAFLGAGTRPGIDLVLEAVDFAARIEGADLCLTGEGRLDGQSLSGKACLGVAQAAKYQNVPTVALVGAATDDADRCLEAGLDGWRVIGEGLEPAESMRRAAELLEVAAREVVRERMD